MRFRVGTTARFVRSLIVATAAMLLSASGAQAAQRGAVLVKDVNPGRAASITATGCPDFSHLNVLA